VDIATLIGILVSFGLVIVSIMMDGEGVWFVNAPSVMIVCGGTMGAMLLAYALGDVLSGFNVAKNVFMQKSQSASELIPLISGFAMKGRQEGILSFESQLSEIEDPASIHTKSFPSNWELSISRAVNVVKFLVDLGHSTRNSFLPWVMVNPGRSFPTIRRPIAPRTDGWKSYW
jgi:hypothetical protein